MIDATQPQDGAFWIARCGQSVYVVRSGTALGAARLGARRHYPRSRRVVVRESGDFWPDLEADTKSKWLATAVLDGRSVAFGMEVSRVLLEETR